MSHDCQSDVVPYVMHSVFCMDRGGFEDSPPHAILVLPEEVLEKEFSWQDPTYEYSFEDLEVNGWGCFLLAEDAGKHGLVFGPKWAKKDSPNLRVYLINEDSASNAGEYDVAVVADDRESIEAFYNDMRDLVRSSYGDNHPPILGPNEAVQQWM